MNTLTLVASLAALVVSVFFAVRQSRLMRGSNQLPVVISFFNEHRSDRFLERERYLWAQLPGLHDPRMGFEGLPEPLRDAMYDVCIFYQEIAYLVSFKVLDRRLAYLAFHFRAVQTWIAAEPFVRGERERRGAEGTFLNAFEDFVEFVKRKDMRSFGSSTLGHATYLVAPEASGSQA